MAKTKTTAKGKKVPDATSYIEPSQRTFVVWTPALIRAAETTADAGNLRLAAQLCDAILADDRAAPVLRTRVRALFGCELGFLGTSNRRNHVKAKREKEATEDFFIAYPENILGQVLTWGHLMGIGPAKQTWTDHLDRVVPKISFWHPGNLRFDWPSRQWFTRVDGGGEIPIVAGDGVWLLHMPEGDNRPWNHGLWRQIARWWLLKSYAMQDFGRHSEVHGNPITVGFTMKDVAVRKEDRKELAEDLGKLGRSSSIALPPGFDIKLIEATARTWEMFQAQINLANTAIAIAVLGQNMTTEPGANQNGITGAREMRNDLLDSDAETTQTFLREQSMVYWAEFNFGDPEQAPWPSWDTSPPEDQQAKASAFKSFADAMIAFDQAGFEVENAEELAEQYGLQLKRKEKEPPPEPAPSPFPPVPAPNNGAPANNGAPPKEPPAPPPPPKKGERALPSVEALLQAAVLLAATGEKGTITDDGQAYADELAAAMSSSAIEKLRPTLEQVLAIVNDAESYEDMQARLIELHKTTDIDALADVTQNALILAELAGRHAVLREL